MREIDWPLFCVTFAIEYLANR